MLPWLTVAGLVVAAVRRGLHLQQAARQAAAQSPTAGPAATSQRPPDHAGANAATDAAYRQAVAKLGIAAGAPPPEALPLPLRAEIAAAGKAGHAADTAALAEQIANAVQTRQLSPEAERWIADQLANAVGGAVSLVPILGPLAKAAWGAAYRNRGADPSAPTIAHEPSKPPSRHQARWASGRSGALPAVGVADSAYTVPVRGSNNPVAGDIAAIDVTKL